jgi:hypothetical protein
MARLVHFLVQLQASIPYAQTVYPLFAAILYYLPWEGCFVPALYAFQLHLALCKPARKPKIAASYNHHLSGNYEIDSRGDVDPWSQQEDRKRQRAT